MCAENVVSRPWHNAGFCLLIFKVEKVDEIEVRDHLSGR